MTEYPWLKSYPENVNWDVTYQGEPVSKLLDDTFQKFPQSYAYDFLGKKATYADLHDQVNRAAKGLQALGVKKGIKVGLFMPNCPQFIISYYAILKTGATVVNYSPLYSVPELLQQVEDSETDIMLTLNLTALYPNIRTVCEQSRLKKLIVSTLQSALPFPKNILFPLLKSSEISTIVKDEYHLSFDDLMDNDGAYDPVEIDPDEDIAVLQYTGGTTGVPKGAMLSHSNLYVNVIQQLDYCPFLEPGKDVSAGFLPFFHVFAMTVVMNMAISIGAKTVLLPRFNLNDAVKIIRKEKLSLFAGVPTMYTAILGHPDLKSEDMASIKMCFSGGAPLPVELQKNFREKFNVNVSEGYGLTESSPVACGNPLDRPGRVGSIGLPMPGTEVIIVDREDPHKILPYGETGEICIRGPQVMKGYWKRPDATNEVIVNGMLRTGDVGYIGDDGYTYIIDRDKDLILVGGFNVFPRHVEEAIHQHPAVNEVTVIGIPDDYRGESPKAFIALNNPDEDLTEQDMLDFLKDKLGKHEMPSEIEFREELPKTMIGKLSKKELVAEEKAKYEARKAQKA